MVLAYHGLVERSQARTKPVGWATPMGRVLKLVCRPRCAHRAKLDLVRAHAEQLQSSVVNNPNVTVDHIQVRGVVWLCCRGAARPAPARHCPLCMSCSWQDALLKRHFLRRTFLPHLPGTCH